MGLWESQTKGALGPKPIPPGPIGLGPCGNPPNWAKNSTFLQISSFPANFRKEQSSSLEPKGETPRGNFGLWNLAWA